MKIPGSALSYCCIHHDVLARLVVPYLLGLSSTSDIALRSRTYRHFQAQKETLQFELLQNLQRSFDCGQFQRDKKNGQLIADTPFSVLVCLTNL